MATAVGAADVGRVEGVELMTGDAEQMQIPDEDVATLVLGMWAAVAARADFPIYLREIEPYRDEEDGRVDYFDMVTASNLRLRTRVEVVR